jgi:hypothetical protein
VPLRAENGGKANWSGMLRVCSPAALDQLQVSADLKDKSGWVERRCSLGKCMKTQVDSAENRVVCLKGFEDDGRGFRATGRHYPKQPPSADLPGSLTKG